MLLERKREGAQPDPELREAHFEEIWLLSCTPGFLMAQKVGSVRGWPAV